MTLYKSSRSRLGRTRVLALMIALTGVACRRATKSQAESGPVSGASGAGAQVSRAEAVQEADRLASLGTSASGDRARALLSRAADIRERLFRIEHRAVDGLEAVELLRSIERGSPPACDAALRRIGLEAEVKQDPRLAFREIYALRARSTRADCRVIADRALKSLAAYRPLPGLLGELERDAEAAEPSASASAARPAPASFVVMPPSVDSQKAARVTRVERYGAKDAARVVVFVTRPTRFEVADLGVADGRPRVVVDIEGAVLAHPETYVVGGLVEGVRLGKRPEGARVVLDLARAASRRVFYLPEPFRLVIDVFEEDERDKKAHEKRSIRRVVLDPGHGGHDPGAIGPAGLREKDVALDVAHRAAPLIARELGIATLLTRDGDQYVALDERTARANAFHADLFVSIHCNASEDPAATGVMSFVLDQGREELAERVAARENAASSEAAAELANALSSVADPSSLRASFAFAELLQRSAMASLRERYPEVPNAGVKRAGFYVLAGARMPSALFETSFISNPIGERRLNTEDFRQKLADSIVNAIRAYREGI